MRRHVEDLDRDRDDDDDAPPPAFQCPCCQEVLGIEEGVVLERHPEMPRVCLNCLCA
ncbi:hypothetical protein [Methylobacterium sp. WL64]|uniref:hypothetical protein n=1 Tax=Methylobacterium sp. WL64 TaxID=2603894 RepID=UPI0016505344|nr:hypothetical protein [Methylobacterium sp. WL64]